MKLDETAPGVVPLAEPEVDFEQEVRVELRKAALDGLADAPRLLAEALRIEPPARWVQRIHVASVPGKAAQGEALRAAGGSIRLSLGRDALEEDVRNIARHEALHLLLASSLSGGDRWSTAELAFAEWIVRGIESGGHAPELALAQLPRSRTEAAALDFARDEADPKRRLWRIEAALGAHFLRRAAQLGEGALRAVLLDDWLLDYEQYARAVGNAPTDAGNLWRLEDPGWSREPLVRLSAAAQALQRDDLRWFSNDAPSGKIWIWKNRGRVRLPVLELPAGPRPHPIRGFRAASDDPAVEDAARGEARNFEARVLWARIVARLLPAEGASAPSIQIADGPGADEALRIWRAAAESLRPFVDALPQVFAPRELPPDLPLVLVHGSSANEESIARYRPLAATHRIRGALFRGSLRDGTPWETLPDFAKPLDPRYRDEVWEEGPLPGTLVALADEATREGRLSTPLAHLLSLLSFGVEEWLYR